MNCEDYLRRRHSIRKYIKDSKNEINPDLIREILTCAEYAPSAGNMKPWKFIVYTKDKEIKQIHRLIEKSHNVLRHEFTKNYSEDVIKKHLVTLKQFELFFENVSAIIFVFCQKKNKALEKYYQHLSHFSEVEQDAELGYVNIQSCAAAIQNILLKISDLNLGACWMQIPYFAKKDIINHIGNIDKYDLLAMIPIGIPHKVPDKKNRRKFNDFMEMR